MNSNGMLRLALALALTGAAAPVFAQVADDPGVALTRHLETLAQDPRDFDALIGAGRAALAVGDARAAVTFFGRAEAVRPNDGTVKAGLGSAVVQLEQPREALDYFGQAARLGTPDYVFAGDRGLAYDLLGDPRRAQQDYRLALQHGEDDEVRRRLALSLAIGGDRAGALAAIDAQLRRQDRSAWRTRAFIQALTGDTGGATETAASVMSPDQAQAMRPFFAELATLTPAQRAMAVHFGDMPSEGGATQVAGGFQSDAPSLPLAADRAGTLDIPAGTVMPSAPRRRPDATQVAVAPPTRPVYSPPTIARAPEPARPAPSETPKPEPIASAPPLPTPAPAPTPPITAVSLAPSGVGDGGPAAAPSPKPVESAAGFAGLAASIAALKEETAASRLEVQGPELAANTAPAKPAPKPAAKPVAKKTPEKKPAEKTADEKKVADKKADDKKSADDKKAAAKKAVADKKPAKPVEPSRHWVQVAGGANKATLPREFAKLQDQAPKLLGKRSAWTTRLNATNRLLVGPFKSDEEAQDFVNDLRKAKVSAFGFTSEDGQKIEKLSGK